MKNVVNRQVFPNLTALQSRVAGIAARPKPLAVGCIVSFGALGWIACGLIAAGPTEVWSVLCRPTAGASWDGTNAALVLGMWAAMVLAMMVPTASPMILTYAEIADTAGRVGERVVSPLVLIAGYVAVWLAFAPVATAAQILAGGWVLGPTATVPPLLAGGLIFAAGVYQFSSLKHACLSLCQRPFPFFFANWTDKPSGIFELGLRQGLYCLGCCWPLMLVMFAVGIMNVVWMALLGALMTTEKMMTTDHFARALGVCLITAGAAVAAFGLV